MVPSAIFEESEETLRSEIRAIRQEKPRPKKLLHDFAMEQLQAMTYEEQLLGISAKRSEQRLSAFGVFLVSISIIAPIVSAVLYYLDSSRGTEPSKDWHILLAGLSFGFLILVAGRGLLRQATTLRQAYYRARRRQSHHEGLVSAIKIAQRSEKNMSMSLPVVIDKVIGILFQSVQPEQEAEEDDSPDFPTKEQLKTLLSVFRKA